MGKVLIVLLFLVATALSGFGFFVFWQIKTLEAQLSPIRYSISQVQKNVNLAEGNLNSIYVRSKILLAKSLTLKGIIVGENGNGSGPGNGD